MLASTAAVSLVFVTLLACKKDKPEVAQRPCYYLAINGSPDVDATITWNGEKSAGGIRKKSTSYRYYDQAGVEGRVKVPADKHNAILCMPQEKFLSDGGDFTIERDTPCGEKPIKLKLSKPVTREWEEKAREDAAKGPRKIAVVELDTVGAEVLPATSIWYIPAEKTALTEDHMIEVGGAKLTYRAKYNPDKVTPSPRKLYGITCAEEHAIKINGREVGKLKLEKDEILRGVVVNDRPEACYHIENVHYSSQPTPLFGGGGGWKNTLQGPVLRLKKISKIEHFLKRAPSSKRYGGSVIELYEKPCKAEKKKKK